MNKLNWKRGPAIPMKYTLRSYLLFPFIGQDRAFWSSYPYHIKWWIDLKALQIRWAAARIKHPGQPFSEILGNYYKSKAEAMRACEEHSERAVTPNRLFWSTSSISIG